jgi:hypothetical protein
MNQIYLDTARLLTQVAPIVFQDGVFALKGDTAVNQNPHYTVYFFKATKAAKSREGWS